ncbi:MAG: hypothetical protein AAGI71_08230 [Bacteroidota bacterium]
MEASHRNIASFLVRFTQDLWQDAVGDPQVRWQGTIRHVQGDEQVPFTEVADAVAFMQRELATLTLHTLDAVPNIDRTKGLQESFKIWERFASSYTDFMVGQVQRGLDQTQALRTQVDGAVQEALQAAFPATPATAALQQRVETLEAHVQALEARLAALEAHPDTDL